AHARNLRSGAGPGWDHARALHLGDGSRHAVRPPAGGARRARLDQAKERERAASPAHDPRARRRSRATRDGPRRPASRPARLPLRMSSTSRKLASLALPALAALALGACGSSHSRVTTGTYAGESGASAPYLDVGPLTYEVQLSRALNPYNVEDASYLQGLT